MYKLSLSSSTEEVQVFLRKERFDDSICNKFIKFNGKALLGADKESIKEIVNDIIEGNRLYSILNTLRQTQGSTYGNFSVWNKFLANLEAANIKPRKEVLNRIAEFHYSGIDANSRSVDLSVNFYNLIKLLPSTSTRVKLESALTLHINGPFDQAKPNILTASDSNEKQYIIKLLRVTTDIPYDVQVKEIEQEARVVELLCLNSPEYALVQMEVLEVEMNNFIMKALKMPRYTCALSDYPRMWSNHTIRDGLELVSAIEFIHSQEIVHMDIKESNILIKESSDGKTRLFLGDSGSSKVIGESITSTNIASYSRKILLRQPALAEYDWFMLLMTLLRQSLSDKTLWMTILCDSDEKFSNSKIKMYINSLEDKKLKEFFDSLDEKVICDIVEEIGGKFY